MTQKKHNLWLVVSTHLKNMKVNGKDDIPYIMENKKCSDSLLDTPNGGFPIGKP